MGPSKLHTIARLNEDINFDNDESPGISKGSYHNQRSYLSLYEMRHKNLSMHPLGLESTTPQKSAAEVSQLKLESLILDKNWNDKLDDFQLEELRDGFFDPMFTKPEKNTADYYDSYPKRIKKRTYSIQTILPTIKQFFTGKFKDNCKNKWPQVLKFVLSFFISFVLCVIRPSGVWIGHNHRYLMPIAAILHHPVRNIGVQLEMTAFSILGLVFGLGWSSLAWYVSTATKVVSNFQGGILFQSLFMALMFSVWLKSYYPRFMYFGTSFGMAIIYTHTVELVHHASMMRWMFFRDFALSYVFGLILSLLICVLIYPHSGNESLMTHYNDTVKSFRELLVGMVDSEQFNNKEKMSVLHSKMIQSLNIDLSESFRDFFNQMSIAQFDKDHLEQFRNHLTSFSSPLRVIPLMNMLFDKEELEKLYTNLDTHAEESKGKGSSNGIANSNSASSSQSPEVYSASHSPFTPKGTDLPHHLTGYSEFYVKILKKTFSKPVFDLILEMILVLEKVSMALTAYNYDRSSKRDPKSVVQILEEVNTKLKKKIYRLDITYKKFTQSNIFSQDLLSDHESVNIFLYLRYLRNSSKQLVGVVESCVTLSTDIHWRIQLPQYPLKKALHRLPKQCAIDEGSDSFLRYFETKKAVDDIFERIYNSYTSKHAYTKPLNENERVRAIDHRDFGLHTTKNTYRYRLWQLSRILVGPEMKWTFKIVFVIVFLCIPAWLPESHHWYANYQCWWAPMSFYILVHRKPTGGYNKLLMRLGISVLAMFWGWAANQARHYSNAFVICTFAALLCVPASINLLWYGNPKVTFAALISFTVVALEPYSIDDRSTLNTASIWKNTWITSLSLIIGILVSVTINWIFWSYKARTELRLAMSSLLLHLSQSYQSIADRYLYRDTNDSPTEMTLAFAHIREVRMTQNIDAVRNLLKRARLEPNYISNFNADKYDTLLTSCQYLLEKLIEARISGTYFEVWDRDMNKEVTRALLSLRRDSVASVIFVFYVIGNCFRSRNRIPKYLPNTILSRKRLFDYLSAFTSHTDPREHTNTHTQEHLGTQLLKNKIGKFSQPEEKYESAFDDDVNFPPKQEFSVDEYQRLHWTEVYGVVFGKAFTDVCEAVQNLSNCCKDILGEEG
ncbi:Bre4p KNAG_0E02850 [Huiozyma naganishii CBS 8797]|uniref:DUF2421 domain-containing protein n=1 Tax=Huiozyma naganishii (strain ATCC MYA-139 / BCRC 22969 / CBS 8797 / KCTC 17520 / NBRC 10181 / NCYC 3082 / Yp74L-3) TaxID=1071383 RepID=J7S6S6_HUIN7|nr:hypothetical protein KNAG_0E02850 [Kazachstania naganishii CBS 8797]CCK70544.1 hypothetical protein KNAG_0E02850 [Kazachstania naganishii CBS 8797]